MCEWHVRNNTKARTTARSYTNLSFLVLREDTPGLETYALLHSLDLSVLFHQGKRIKRYILNQFLN